MKSVREAGFVLWTESGMKRWRGKDYVCALVLSRPIGKISSDQTNWEERQLIY